MNRLLHTPVALLLRRIGLVYLVLMLCRAVFYLYNYSLLGPLGWSEAGQLLRGALLFDTSSVVYADGIFVLLALLPLHVREKRWYRKMLFWYYALVNSVLVVGVNLADAVYFRYTQKRFTADEIFFADNDNSLLLAGKFLLENWYLALIAAALVALLVWGYGRRAREESLLSRGWARYAGSTLVFVVATGLCVAGMRGGMTRMTRPITLSNATLYTPDNARANLILSNPFCILRTIGDAGDTRYTRYFPDEELPHRFTPEHRPADSTAVDLAGRNVMIFIMESMSAEHSAYLMPEVYEGYETKGFTPFLDSLMREGFTFRRMYANGARSIQALPAVLGSIPSFRTPFVLMPQSLGESRQLPALLRERGYATAFFCGSDRGSMGFGAYARSAGIERLFSREEYEARHGRGDFDGSWGIWDEPFLQFAGEELAQLPQPFFGVMFTLSSHHPFRVPAEYEATLPDGYTRIHKGVAYVDNAFRQFFRRFGGQEWFRRTIFVFVADHVSSEKFAPETATYPGNHRIIGFMYTPDGALRGETDEVVQQLDLMPTLLGALGNREPYFAFGRDVLAEPERPRWSVSWDGKFRALTGEGVLEVEDAEPAEAARAETDSLRNDFRALIQQYYRHIERKKYTCDD